MSRANGDASAGGASGERPGSAVRIDVLRTQIRLRLPRATPDQTIFAWVLTRMSRLIV